MKKKKTGISTMVIFTVIWLGFGAFIAFTRPDVWGGRIEWLLGGALEVLKQNCSGAYEVVGGIGNTALIIYSIWVFITYFAKAVLVWAMFGLSKLLAYMWEHNKKALFWVFTIIPSLLMIGVIVFKIISMGKFIFKFFI